MRSKISVITKRGKEQSLASRIWRRRLVAAAEAPAADAAKDVVSAFAVGAACVAKDVPRGTSESRALQARLAAVVAVVVAGVVMAVAARRLVAIGTHRFVLHLQRS